MDVFQKITLCLQCQSFIDVLPESQNAFELLSFTIQNVEVRSSYFRSFRKLKKLFFFRFSVFDFFWLKSLTEHLAE